MDWDNVSMIPRLVNSSKIKYVVLEELFASVEIDSNTVNLFVDGFSLVHRLYRKEFSADVYMTNKKRFIIELVVSVTNVIAHYRRFLITRLRKNNRIFIVFNRKLPIFQSEMVEDYGYEYYDNFSEDHVDYGPVNNIVNKAMALIKDLLKYFEDVYFIDNQKIEDHAAIAYLMKDYDGFNIILSRNELMYQLLDKRTIMLYPKRDSSFIVTKKNCFNQFFRNVKYTPTNMTSGHALFYFTLSGIKSRNLRGICLSGTVKGAKMIDSMITNDGLSSDTSIQSFIRFIQKTMNVEFDDDTIDVIINRYKALSSNISISAFTGSQKKRIKNSIINLYDQQGLEKLNESMDNVEDVLNLSDLNMNAIQTRKSFWDWDNWGFY